MLQYNIYKGKSSPGATSPSKWGACQFSIKYPDLDKRDAGVVFVNAASAKAPDVYDWDNKFVFALGLTDIGKILHFFISAGEKGTCNLVHDPNKGRDNEGSVIKSMNFYTQSGCLGGCMITCSTKNGSETVSHKIPVTGDEVVVLKCLLERSVSVILGW